MLSTVSLFRYRKNRHRVQTNHRRSASRRYLNFLPSVKRQAYCNWNLTSCITNCGYVPESGVRLRMAASAGMLQCEFCRIDIRIKHSLFKIQNTSKPAVVSSLTPALLSARILAIATLSDFERNLFQNIIRDNFINISTLLHKELLAVHCRGAIPFRVNVIALNVPSASSSSVVLVFCNAEGCWKTRYLDRTV